MSHELLLNVRSQLTSLNELETITKNATFQKLTFLSYLVVFHLSAEAKLSLILLNSLQASFTMKSGPLLVMTLSSALFTVMDSKSQTRGPVNLVGLWLITSQPSWKTKQSGREEEFPAAWPKKKKKTENKGFHQLRLD